MPSWVEVCTVNDVEREDVLRVDHAGRVLAIYRTPDDQFFATDGLCTHEQADLTAGLVIGDLIECPMHNGRFNYKTGEAKRAPVCVKLTTYAVKRDGVSVFAGLR